MLAKIAFAGDLHKRPKDISTIKGYVKCCDTVEESLLAACVENNITHFVSLGDLYDKGYVDDISAALADTSLEEHFHKVLDGNFYGVIGNHIRLRLDSNPELALIQPHPTIKSRKKIRRDYQIMKTPSHIMIGTVQISLVHHNPVHETVEDYRITRMPETTYHIACVHDPRFIPNSELLRTQIPSTRSLDTQISRTLKDVDLCICGDIHQPLGMFQVGDTKMYVPGSLTNTNAGKKSRHGTINIPIITIDDDSSIKLEFLPFDLKLNMLNFSDVAEESVASKLKSYRGNVVEKLYEGQSFEGIISTGISSMSFGSFIQEQGYCDSDKNLIKLVIKDPENLTNLIKAYRERTVQGDL